MEKKLQEAESTSEPFALRKHVMALSMHRHDSILRQWSRKVTGETVRTDPPGSVLQLQLFIESHAPLDSQEQADAQALFAQEAPLPRVMRRCRTRQDENSQVGAGLLG